MHVSKSVISKHAAYTDLNGTGQGYMPKMCLQVCMTLRSYICNHSLRYLSGLSRTSDFPFAAKKTPHTLTPINATFTIILSAVTNIFILIDDYEVISCSSMEPTKLVTFNKHFRR